MNATNLIDCYLSCISAHKSLLLSAPEHEREYIRALIVSYEARVLELRQEIADGQD